MKNFKFILFFFVSIFLFSSLSAAAEEHDSYILKLKNNDNFNLISAEERDFLLSSKISSFSALKNQIEYIEPNYDVFLHNTQEINWNFTFVNANIPQEYGCYGNEIKIAVIDSGVYPHELLKQNLSAGYNFVDNSYDTSDNIGHGTFVASIISAAVNNTYTEGIAPKSKVIPLKCFEGNKGSIDKICEAIKYAVDVKKCSIINMSFGLSNNSSALKEAVEYALSKNVILVSSVGNNGTSKLTYPSAYNGVVGVGAVDKNLNVCNFSQHNNSVDVVAPGEDLNGILVSGNNKNSGTSFSAPHVSAAAAIALCIDDEITPQRFNDLIQSTSTDLGDAGYDFYYGNGLLNIGKMSEQLIEEKNIFISPINIDSLSSKVTIVNNQSDCTAFVTFADYNGKYLNNCIINNVNLASKEKVDVSFPINGRLIKYFVWNTAKQPIPLTKTREYIIDSGE